jgi:spoIIIJ-associated protein
MMTQTKEIHVSANTVEQAVVRAAGQLSVPQDRLGYEVISKRGALLSIFAGSKVEIRAWIKTSSAQQRGNERHPRQERQSRSQPQPRNNKPRHHDEDTQLAPAQPLSAKEMQELQQELREYCAGICDRIVGEPVKVTTFLEGDDRLIVNIENDELAAMIERNSKLAEALEHLLRKKPSHLQQQLPFRIFVDVGGVRKNREQELIQVAQEMSNKVALKKRPIVLNYKSSYDRKIIHMALDKDSRVYTKSIGAGPNRKLMILPSKGTPVNEQDYEEVVAE